MKNTASPCSLEGLSTSLVVFQEVVDAGEIEPSGKRQRYWGPINESRIGGDSQGENESGQESGGEHFEAVESAERVLL